MCRVNVNKRFVLMSHTEFEALQSCYSEISATAFSIKYLYVKINLNLNEWKKDRRWMNKWRKERALLPIKRFQRPAYYSFENSFITCFYVLIHMTMCRCTMYILFWNIQTCCGWKKIKVESGPQCAGVTKVLRFTNSSLTERSSLISQKIHSVM